MMEMMIGMMMAAADAAADNDDDDGCGRADIMTVKERIDWLINWLLSS